MTLPYLTCGIPGCSGIIKSVPADFVVEEIPAYLPGGVGEHLYLWVEKSGITTLEAIRRISRAFNVQERDMGYAGMKDAVGVTRQFISVPRVSPEQAMALDLPGISILSAERHANKLKPGHLKGNRFRIVIRETVVGAAETALAILDQLGSRGVPNYFGYQRYGAQGNSHLIGLAMLRRDWQGAVEMLIGDVGAVRDGEWQEAISAYKKGDLVAAQRLFPSHCAVERELVQRLLQTSLNYEKAFRSVQPRLRKLYLSACQSFLFDQVVARRIAANTLDMIFTGDLALKHANGACFLVEDAVLEQARVRNLEISPSGPMFGCTMKQAQGVIGEMEQSVLDSERLHPTDFDLSGGLRLEGERRPIRVPLEEASCTEEPDCLALEFVLPRGSYATSVLREVMKSF